MSQLTRDYKGTGRRPMQVSGMKEFAFGMLAGALLAGGGAALLAVRSHHRQTQPAACAAPVASGSTSPVSGRSTPSIANGPGTRHSPSAPRLAAAPPGATASAAASGAASVSSAQNFDFYRMLPRFTVPVPANHAAAPASRPRPAAITGAAFVLQVGSYSSDAEARHVRARLARMGIAARIQQVSEHGVRLNRVRVGPVGSGALRRLRAALAAADFHPLVIPSRGQ